jgi:hypothetical protein
VFIDIVGTGVAQIKLLAPRNSPESHDWSPASAIIILMWYVEQGTTFKRAVNPSV